MTLLDWIPSISTSTVVAVIGFIVGGYYKAHVERVVSHHYDQKMERLPADLKNNTDEMAALRSGALTGMSSRHIALDQRRLLSAERLWSAVVELARHKNIALIMQSVKTDYAMKIAAQSSGDSPKIKQFAEQLWKSSGIEQHPAKEAVDRERPFLSSSVWELFFNLPADC